MSDKSRPQPTLVFLLGPPAVGTMTVGQELERRTGFRLFHLHQVLDLLTDYFAFDSPSFERIAVSYRAQFFAEAAASGLSLITTGGWDFDDPRPPAIFRRFVAPYRDRGRRAYFVELLAPLAVLLERHRTENRRRHKKTAWATDDYLRRFVAAHRYDSGGRFPLHGNVPLLRIDTEHLTAEQTAARICAHFDLPRRVPADGHG